MFSVQNFRSVALIAALLVPGSVVAAQTASWTPVAPGGLRNTGELGRAQMSAGLLSYRFACASRLTMPVLVVAGARDGSIGTGPQRTLARSIRGARYVEHPSAGHFVYLDEPQSFADEVAAFIRGGDR